MRYALVVVLSALATSAWAEITREQCLELLLDAEQDREGLNNYVNALIDRFYSVSELDTQEPLEKALQDATFAFADQVHLHLDRYTEAVSNLCRDKI